MHKQVNDYWAEHVKSRALMYTTLEYLTVDKYYPGKKHWLLQHSGIAREIPTVHLKLKIVTGTYILQVNRSTFNQNEIDPTCLMCKEEPETVDHFLIRCSALADVRKPIMDSILRCAECFIQAPIETQVLTQLLLDCVGVFSDSKDIQVQSFIINIEKLAKRLCLTLHTERYKRLNLIPKRNKKSGGKGCRSTQQREIRPAISSDLGRRLSAFSLHCRLTGFEVHFTGEIENLLAFFFSDRLFYYFR